MLRTTFALLLILLSTEGLHAQQDTLFSDAYFEVRFPENTIVREALEDSLNTWAVYMEDTSGTTYAVSVRDRATYDTINNTYEAEKNMLEYATLAEISDESNRRMKRYKGITFSAKDSTYRYSYFILLTRSFYYRVVVFGPSESFNEAKATEFVDSFRLKKR